MASLPGVYHLQNCSRDRDRGRWSYRRRRDSWGDVRRCPQGADANSHHHAVHLLAQGLDRQTQIEDLGVDAALPRVEGKDGVQSGIHRCLRDLQLCFHRRETARELVLHRGEAHLEI